MITGDPTHNRQQALAGLQAALDLLIDCTRSDELANDANNDGGDDELLDFARGFEVVRNRMAVVDHEIVTACDTNRLAQRLAHCGTTKLLVDTLHITEGEALRRVRAAHALHGRFTMMGEPEPAERPELARAVAAGTIPAGNTERVLRSLTRLSQLPWTDDSQIVEAEHTLTQAAQQFPPKELDQCIAELADALNPDGTYSDDQVEHAKRDLYLWQDSAGGWHMQGHPTPALAQKMKTVLDPLTQPQDVPDEPDLRTPGQRRHDALEEVFDRLLASGDNPDMGGTPASVIVTITYQDLANRTGHGCYTDGSSVSPQTLLSLADQTDLITALLNADGKALWLGRDRRIADKNQTMAMIARDGGCSFPGCDRAAQWCQRHHVISWAEGGPTNIDNLTLVCSFHHHHFERAGWQCRMIDGLPYWIPPKWIDREQTPRLNYRIRQRIRTRRHSQDHRRQPDLDCPGHNGRNHGR